MDPDLFKYICKQCGLAYEDTREEVIKHANLRGDCPRCGHTNEPENKSARGH